jgi:ribonuclease-3
MDPSPHNAPFTPEPSYTEYDLPTVVESVPVMDDDPDIEDVVVERVTVGGGAKPRFGSPEERIHACEDALGYTFFNKSLIKNALTHSSSTSDKRLDNERMEFFGDAVLDLVIREYLYHNYPNRQEGDLTEAKSAVVCRTSLVKAAKRIGLKNYLILGRGMGKRRAVPDSLLADAYEAIVAAVYLDGGYQPVRNFILMTLGEEIPFAIDQASSANSKSNLQRILQQQKRPLPVYRVLGTTGPEHSRIFQVAVLIEGEEMGRGSGSSKRRPNRRPRAPPWKASTAIEAFRETSLTERTAMLSELLEVAMVISFGAAWPASILKSYRSRTARGKSLSFMIIILFGYLCGVGSKFATGNVNYVVVFYVINFLAVSVDLALYARNRRLDVIADAVAAAEAEAAG